MSEAVWVVRQGDGPPGVLIAVYDNEAAAKAHVAFWDDMVLGGHAEMLRAEEWTVQRQFVGEIDDGGDR